MSTKKIISILVIIATIICTAPTAISDETAVTGTFTPIPTGISIACNNTAPAFGDINLNSNKEIVNFNLTNEGDVNCSVTMTAEDGEGSWTLASGTSSPATTNEYCVNMDPQDKGYLNVYTEQSVISDLPPSGSGQNYTYFDLKVFTSKFTDEGTPGQQTFYANLTAGAIS